MTTLRRLCATSALTLIFALPALAGEISTMAVPPPPPPGEIETPAAPGEIHTPGEMHTGAPGEMLTPPGEAAATLLGLLQTALSLL
jgi:hypothetical protein